MGRIRPVTLGIGIALILGGLHYFSLLFDYGEPRTEDVLLWLTTLIAIFVISIIFKADFKTTITSLILNPVFTLLIESVFRDQFSHLYALDTSITFNLFRLLLKTGLETMPVLLGLVAWNHYFKLRSLNKRKKIDENRLESRAS